MEIRRMEPELIQPAKSSDESASVLMDRRPLQQHPERRPRQRKPYAPPTEAEEVTPASPTYTQHGQITEQDERISPHAIDFTA